MIMANVSFPKVFPVFVVMVLVQSVALTMVAHTPAHADTLVGRWCDTMIPGQLKYKQLIVITITDKGAAEMHSELGDGSSGTYRLKEKSGNIFEMVGSGSGDKYRVVPGNGDLQLLDNEGLIRTARRLDAKPRGGIVCLKGSKG